MKILRIIFWSLGNLKHFHLVKLLLVIKYLKKSQYWDKDKIDSSKSKQIIRLTQALASSKYYSRKFKNSSGSIDFTRLGFIDKEVIKKNSHELMTKYFTSKYPHTTSGSTGDPIKVYLSRKAIIYRKALRWRFLKWWNLKPYDRNVLIWGRKLNKKRSLFSKIKEYLRGRKDINVFDLNDYTIKKYFEEIESFRPKFIRGYKSAIYELARLFNEKNLSFQNTKLKVAIVTSEVLYKEERLFIEKILKCPVANEYGSAEAGLFAYECPAGNMHINEETQILITDQDNNVIVTEIYNDSMPLINYRIGDKIKISAMPCSCGRSSRIIEYIEGRENDYIISPSGQRLSQYIFYYIMKELEDIGFSGAIQKYKVLQERNKFILNIMIGPTFNDKCLNYIKERMKEQIGIGIEVTFNVVEKIELERSGKLRFFKRIV